MKVTLIQEDNIKTFDSGDYVVEAYWTGGNIAICRDDATPTEYISMTVDRFQIPSTITIENTEQITNIKLSITRLKADNKMCLLLSTLCSGSERGVAFLDGGGVVNFDDYNTFVSENCISQPTHVLLNPSSWDADWSELDMLARTYFMMSSSVGNESVQDTLALLLNGDRTVLTVNKIKGTYSVVNAKLAPHIAYTDESTAAEVRQELLAKDVQLHNDIVDLNQKVNRIIGEGQNLYVSR